MDFKKIYEANIASCSWKDFAKNTIDKIDGFYEDYGDCIKCGYNTCDVIPFIKQCEARGIDYDENFAGKFDKSIPICDDCFEELLQELNIE